MQHFLNKCAKLLNALSALLFTLCLPLPLAAQSSLQTIRIPEEDLSALITFYRRHDPSKTVALWRQKMPPPVTDPSFRSAIRRHLPLEFTKLIINDPLLVEATRRVLNPVLDLYGRSRIYDLLLIDTPTPLMMADSGVLLLISTGMIERAHSDDELLGYAAHEIGHEFLVTYSVAANYLDRMIHGGGNEPFLVRRVEELLAIVELQCDAFAALTMAWLRQSPLEFIKGIEQDSRDFPDYRASAHPAEEERRRVVEDVVPDEALRVEPRETEGFRHLKQMVLGYEAVKTRRK